ncbi:MAG: HAD family phosphatase [Deltaproteobacteria bacterium]|nr:HAD family phosphatase [Deltaproteobacteria bacterium]
MTYLMQGERFQVKAILFDLDGTIIDTEPLAASVVRFFLKKWKIKHNSGDLREVVGKTWKAAIHEYYKRFQFPVSEREVLSSMLKRYQGLLKKKIILIPGAVRTVRLLSHKFTLGLVSGSNSEEVHWILKKLNIKKYFSVILCAEDYNHSKPSPAGYLKAMRLLGVNPGETLIFEDSEAGIKSGTRSGAWVVAVSHANHFGQDQSLAHVKIKNFL